MLASVGVEMNIEHCILFGQDALNNNNNKMLHRRTEIVLFSLNKIQLFYANKCQQISFKGQQK